MTEQEWREKAKKDLEEWNLRQNEQMEKNRANNRYVGLSVAARAATGAAVQPDLPSWDVWGPLPHSGPQPCRDGALPGKGRGPGALSSSGGCAEPPWLGPHWDHSGISVPPAPAVGLASGQVWGTVCAALLSPAGFPGAVYAVMVTLLREDANPLSVSLFLTLCLPVCSAFSLSLCLGG